MSTQRKIVVFIAFVFFSTSCKKDKSPKPSDFFVFEIPPGFPEIVFPDNNPYSYESWLLGKYLFYDNRLSLNNELSCASCHKQHLGFADDVQFSFGSNNTIGNTNAPTLANVAYNPYYLFPGGVPTLEMQILVPIQEHHEFNTNMIDILEKLKTDAQYEMLSQLAYNRKFDAFVLTRALANFERTLVSGNSRFDKQFNQNKPNLNASELRGYDLFFSDRTNCFQCHGGFNFTSFAFENNGLYEEYSDLGRMLITHNEEDRSKFKIPTLRNIALTAPYMHDGSMLTLHQVIEHYNSGGANHPSKNQIIQPLGLTSDEKEDLYNFLLSLTDTEFINKKDFKKPN